MSESENLADRMTDALIERSRDGFDEIGAELEARFRELLSVQVEGTGKEVVRSKPGEAPRRESGGYEGSFKHVTTVEGDTVATRAGTEDPRGAWFTGGTATMQPRPHAETVRDEFAEHAEERVLQAISNKQE